MKNVESPPQEFGIQGKKTANARRPAGAQAGGGGGGVLGAAGID